MRLTMGGEPTFVSIDDMDGAEWNTAALGAHKRERAGELLRRLWQRFAPGGLLHYGQGKWYPGEPLPRWALSCFWRSDGKPMWQDPSLLADPETRKGRMRTRPSALPGAWRAASGVPEDHAEPGYEDALYYLWKEGNLPHNVDVLDSRLDDKLERERLRRLFDQGLDQVVGFALPLAWEPVSGRWISSRWQFRRRPHVPGARRLADGAAPAPGCPGMGARGTAPDSCCRATASSLGRPFPNASARSAPATAPSMPTPVAHPEIREQGPAEAGGHWCEPPSASSPGRGACTCSSLPSPIWSNGWTLIEALESEAAALELPLVLEGYEPPHDERLQRLSVTPDPGVIEVNIHPAASWRELVGNTATLYEEARLARLGTEKVHARRPPHRHRRRQPRHHRRPLAGGQPDPAPAPGAGQPVTFWQNHPSLSYLFSGLFIGPTSQAPRVDEGRDDSLYELEIALQQLPPGETPSPWLVDRVLRNLLIDLTGNTHRAEFCIDKLYSPDSPAGRRGLVEFRAFEMPPHYRMSAVQMLLLRTLIARFWDHPTTTPWCAGAPNCTIASCCPTTWSATWRTWWGRLNAWGYPFDPAWLDPFLEFRFPRYGSVQLDDIELELRFAIEPWNVLGEEVTAQGTARFVDSSVERLQVGPGA